MFLGNAEAYGCSLDDDDELDSDNMMEELNKQEINVEIRGEQVIHDLEDNKDASRANENSDNKIYM